MREQWWVVGLVVGVDLVEREGLEVERVGWVILDSGAGQVDWVVVGWETGQVGWVIGQVD